MLLSFSKSILVHREPDKEFQLAPLVLSEPDHFFSHSIIAVIVSLCLSLMLFSPLHTIPSVDWPR